MFSNNKQLEIIFRFVSYLVTAISLFSLLISSSIGIISTVFFLFIIIFAWKFEGLRWQISEKLGVILILLLIPFFYLDWKYNISGFNSNDTLTSGSLSRLILALISIKLLQHKSDRDWVLIYIISFFEILLSAGVGISPLFLLCLLFYLLTSFTSIILFEIRKSSNSIGGNNEKKQILQGNVVFNKYQIYRLPVTALLIMVAISIFAIPLFFVFPRVGGAGLGTNIGGLSGFTGFSESVKLGEIGQLKQNDEIVMRVRLKTDGNQVNYLRWRGVSLDTFELQTWRKSRIPNYDGYVKPDGNYFILDNANDTKKLVTQTIYLEPIDTPVLFTLSRPVAIQGNFEYINKDFDGSIFTIRRNSGRISYKVYSDNELPNDNDLQNDNSAYPNKFDRYLQLPKELDLKIPQLSKQIIDGSGAISRLEKVKSVENYLKNNYGYTLDLKAGGKDPLSDFLFNVKEGHCEYFASALAIMLRTQGIATRIVNGFQSGEYNETAEVYVVRQKHAHSWVEVYFPKTRSWVPFDATPSAGQSIETSSDSLAYQINKTLEALETFWIQYVVSYDNNEQRTLFTSLKEGMVNLQEKLAKGLVSTQKSIFEWWQDVKGDKGFLASVWAIGIGIGYLVGGVLSIFLIYGIWKKFKKLQILKRIRLKLQRKKETTVVEFYQRMLKVLEQQGLIRETNQTPLEFAYALNITQAINITEKYHSVRFGERKLTEEESKEIEIWLENLENKFNKK